MKAAQARVLLTGASGGIGQAMAQRLCHDGAAVMGVGRAPRPPAQKQIPMDWVCADLVMAAGVGTVTDAAASWGANVVVHAAGLPAFGPLGALPPAQLQAVLHANLLAPMLLTQALLPRLMTLERAQIVFVGSALGRIGLPGFSVYGASKAGLHGFAEALRRELAGSPVVVQMLGPRSTRTGFNGSAVERYNRATGTRMDDPEAVADALLRLIEDGAAERYIGWPERLAVRLNAALGPWMDGGFARHRDQVRALPLIPETKGSLT